MLPAESNAQSAGSFHLKGVLISPSGRAALVNGRVSEEGDRVAGAEILAIDEGAVRILMGSRELTVNVGAAVGIEPSTNSLARTLREPTRQQSIREQDAAGHLEPLEGAPPAGLAPYGEYGPVQRGETLSGIAQQYLGAGVTMDQMLVALFEANPQAFSGNINVLHQGAVLRIPAPNELGQQPAEAATAEVARHWQLWRAGDHQPTRLAKAADERQYGPVDSGETLSGIAQGLLHEGVTMDQMMMALFAANPQAFSDNINVLYAGAILRIPNTDELRRQSPETATVEVVRHTRLWRTAHGQRAAAALAHADMTAASREPLHSTM